ncbi:MAG: acyltransferase [Methanosarcinales archaeon]|nr:acyltransferase [Methanosarcinales archaeon]
MIYNNILMRLARISPSLSLKLWLYRMMGIRVGSNVSIALEVTMDVFFPQLIEIGDNTIIGYNTTILCHEFLIKEYATGSVVIGRDVMVGANTTILPGITIADGSVVSAHSLVNSDIEGFVGGVPARPLDRN